MFNLIVGFTGDTADASRVLEATDDVVKQYVAPNGRPDPSRLVTLPTLVMPEIGDGEARQVAKIGRLEHLTLTGSSYRFNFRPLREVPSPGIEAAKVALGIGRYEFSRTHWAVKDADLYGVLSEQLAPALSPKVFAFPETPPEHDLVAVMMPFGPNSAPVYEALRRAVAAADLRCQRADDIWLNDALMNDIASLIWRSRVVISDLTSRNPNVFYETGIAHTIGRDVIQITQAEGDVPFDLRHLRYVRYLGNGEGLQDLQNRVTERLLTLTSGS